jgi:hypothetical protein
MLKSLSLAWVRPYDAERAGRRKVLDRRWKLLLGHGGREFYRLDHLWTDVRHELCEVERALAGRQVIMLVADVVQVHAYQAVPIALQVVQVLEEAGVL